MSTVPFSGRLDLTLASLLVTERHTSLANRSVTTEDVAADVIELVDTLDVDADDLERLSSFEDAIQESLDELVEAGWVRRRNYKGVIRYVLSDLGEDALDWIADRLADDPERLHALDVLTNDETEIVLERFGESLRDQPTTT